MQQPVACSTQAVASGQYDWYVTGTSKKKKKNLMKATETNHSLFFKFNKAQKPLQKLI